MNIGVICRTSLKELQIHSYQEEKDDNTNIISLQLVTSRCIGSENYPEQPTSCCHHYQQSTQLLSPTIFDISKTDNHTSWFHRFRSSSTVEVVVTGAFMSLVSIPMTEATNTGIHRVSNNLVGFFSSQHHIPRNIINRDT